MRVDPYRVIEHVVLHRPHSAQSYVQAVRTTSIDVVESSAIKPLAAVSVDQTQLTFEHFSALARNSFVVRANVHLAAVVVRVG